MLSYEGLLEHSIERGIPAGKLRGLVREYIHVLILRALYGLKKSRGLIFLGGTALRLGFLLPRFSEDLDFDCLDISLGEWRDLLEQTAHALSLWGFSVEARGAEKGSLLTGDLRFPEVLRTYGVQTMAGEKLKVKMESNRPGYPLLSEPKAISGFGEMFPALFAAPELFFAEKILALMNRQMARDIYDIYFMGGKKWEPDRRVLEARGVTGNPGRAILERISSWGEKNLAKMAKQLEPFLFNPDKLRLVEEALALLPPVIDYLK